MALIIFPEALDEIRATAGYYRECEPGLDLRFLARVDAAFKTIADAPEAWRQIEPGIHRYLLKIFPYAVLYTTRKGRLMIVAVMHGHRRPGYWKGRLRRGGDYGPEQ